MAAAVDANDSEKPVRELPYAVEIRGSGSASTVLIPLNLLPAGSTEFKSHELQLTAGKYSLYFKWKNHFQNQERFIPEPPRPSEPGVGEKG